MIFGAVGAISYFIGNWVVNRVKKEGSKLSRSDIFPLLCYLAVSGLYTGAIFLGTGAENAIGIWNLFSVDPIEPGKIIQSWSVGSTFAVTMYALTPSQGDNSGNNGAARTGPSNGASEIEAEDTIVEPVLQSEKSNLLQWMTKPVSRRL